MPGIFGFVTKNAVNVLHNKDLLRRMSRSLGYRNSYTDELFWNDRVGLGRRGLSVMNREQPVFNHNRSVLMFMDGSIDEYADTSDASNGKHKDDPGIVLSLYELYGPKVGDRLKGEFNVAFYDLRKQELVILNDRFGFRYLYYYEDEDIFIFAPEIKAILQYPKICRELDETAVADYFNFCFVLGDKTFFRKIRLFPSATILTHDGKSSRTRRYWIFSYEEDYGRYHIDDLVERGFFLLEQSLRRKIKGKKRICVSLTGGLDSRMIIALTKANTDHFKAFTFGTYGCEDYLIAQQVVDELSVADYTFYPIDSSLIPTYSEEGILLTEGMVTSIEAIGIYLSRRLEGEIDVLLNGIFGGHLWVGPGYFNVNHIRSNMTDQEQINDITLAYAKYMEPFRDLVFTEDFSKITRRFAFESVQNEFLSIEAVADLYCNRRDYFFIKNRLGRLINPVAIWKFFFEESRPFLDYDMVDFYLTIPPELKLDQALYTEIVRRKFPNLARIPWQKTGISLFRKTQRLQQLRRKYTGLIRHSICRLSRGRINLSDPQEVTHFDKWFRTNKPLRNFVEDILLDKKTLTRGYFRASGINELLRLQMTGRNYFRLINKLVKFELFARAFIDTPN